MPEAYGNEEIRLVQERTSVSAADALYRDVGPCPENKIWTVCGVGYQPSVAETQVVSFQKITRSGNAMSVYNPTSLNLNPSFATPIESGFTIQLFPGEYLAVRRVAATGGSTMTIRIQFIESDLPLYDYVEPQEALRQKKFGTAIRKMVSRSGAGGGGGGGGGTFGRGGRTGPPAR